MIVNLDPDIIRAWTPRIAIAWFLMLLIAEQIKPLRKQKARAGKRYPLNAAAIALAFGTAAITVGPVIAICLNWTESEGFGLLRMVSLPSLAGLIAGILLMDLSFYYWHRLNHIWPLLWRFHNVHHIDPNLDTTTSFRFHFGEIGYSALFRAAQIGLIGPSLASYAIYEALFICGTLFHHSNLRLPVRIEWAINRVFVTPRMHGIHHSIIMDETNSNYSVVFRWWDPLHRSLRLDVPQEEVNIGVAGYMQKNDNSFKSILLLPFFRQREYWKTPDGKPSTTRLR